MANDETKRYAALEITSKTVKLVYGYVQENLVYVLHALESNVNALDGGVVVESDALTAAIKGVINTANEALGIKINEVLLAVPPMGLVVEEDRAETDTISMDNKIAQIDISNCISQLKKRKKGDDFRIIDIIPYFYTLENNDILYDNPIGRKSASISLTASIYKMDKQLVDGYTKAVENAGIKVKNIVSAPFATALYLTDCEQVTTACQSYYLLNIGSDITTLTQISNKTIIAQNKCFRFGSDRITEKLEEKFNLSFKEAKMLKEKYGIDHSPSFKVLVYNDLTMDDIGICIRENIMPIVNAIKKQIKEWAGNENKYLPVVLTGGGTNLNGLQQLLEKELQLTIIDVTPYSFGARNKSYENCLGLIKYADKYCQAESEDPFVTSQISRTPSKEGRKDAQEYNVNEEL